MLFLITLCWQKIEVFTSKAFRRKGTAALTNIYNQGTIEQQSKATFDTINYKENHFPSTTATTDSTTRLLVYITATKKASIGTTHTTANTV